MRIITFFFSILLGCSCFAQDSASNPEVGQMQVNSDGSSMLKVDGLDIEFDNAGNWSKIYSTYTQPVDFPDRRGIKKAQVIAEEKGKAQIVRFLNQKVESDRLVEEVDNTIQVTARTQGTGKDDKLTRTSQRQMVESVRELTHSYASGNLRGVTVLQTGYDEKAEEVWVKIGLSRGTVAIAKHLDQSMNEAAPPSSSNSSKQGQQSDDVKRQPSETSTERKLPD